jgi:hypothetical protein
MASEGRGLTLPPLTRDWSVLDAETGDVLEPSSSTCSSNSEEERQRMQRIRTESREVAIQSKKAIEALEAQKQTLVQENAKLRASTAQLLGDIKDFVDTAEQVVAVNPDMEPSTSPASYLARWKLYFEDILRSSEAAGGGSENE